MDLPPVSTLTASVHVKIPTAAKNPQITGNGKKDPKFANLKMLAATKRLALSAIPIAVKTPKVARNTASFSSFVTLSSLASVWSTINANPARKGAKNRSFVREREREEEEEEEENVD
jgi:hypothetical protein